MNPLMKFLPEFENCLQANSDKMIDDIIYVIGLSENPKLKALFFEYEHDDYIPVFYSMNEDGTTVIDATPLLIKDRSVGLYKLDNYIKVVPYSLAEKEDGIYQEYLDFKDSNKMKDYWDLSDEYFSEKGKIFEAWFSKCWGEAKSKSNITAESFLRKHDSGGALDLNTLEYVDDDYIESKFQ
jgi:hypothetical protein